MRLDITEKSAALVSSEKKKAVRIGLLGMYASANLGDTAIQTAVLAGLRSRRADVDFVGLSPDPEDTVRTYGIPGFPISGEDRRVSLPTNRPVHSHGKLLLDKAVNHLPFWRRFHALKNIYRQMCDLDMLLISGGGQITDSWGGTWAQPFRLFAWCMCAKLNGKPIASFAVGVDDLRGRLSAWFAVHALRVAKYRTFRDTISLEILRDKGLNVAASVCPDPAFGFCPPPAAGVEARAVTDPKFVVISPISFGAFQKANDAGYEGYLTALAKVAEALLKQGLKVQFVCSQIKMDPPVVSQVVSRMGTDVGVSMAEVKTVNDFVLAVRDAQLVIASRLHALILSLVAGTPIVAIAPGRKVKQQMIDVGLEDYCLDLKSLQVAALLSRVQTALDRRDELQKLISLRINELLEKLEEAFDRLVTFVPDRLSINLENQLPPERT
jgi:polysaccharide pyruvyl transferase WcaK-like protein